MDKKKLDPQVAEFLDGFAEQLSPTEVSLEESRKLLEEILPVLNLSVKKVEDLKIPDPAGEIPIRVYTPSNTKDVPVIVYYHGGGWSRGSLNTAENMCAALANKTGFIVVSVDYRLAPEHPYPAGIDDSYAALKWISKNAKNFGGDNRHLAVAGDSAGGTMAAVMALRARNENGPLIGLQVLICPAINLLEMNTPSYEICAKGYMLSKEWMEHYRDIYVPDSTNWSDPYISPLFEKDLSGLPPAVILTAEFDILRDEAETYGERLKNSGVPVVVSRYPGTIHDFLLLLPRIKASEKAFDEIASVLKERL
ncbi:MAG: alpha/beta hydrolase [Candidatus Omnitrophota bacterium]